MPDSQATRLSILIVAVIAVFAGELTSLLLEGGAMVHRAAWAAGVVDRVQRYIAPVVLGRDGVPWLDDDLSVSTLKDARVERHGVDVMVQGYVQRVG